MFWKYLVLGVLTTTSSCADDQPRAIPVEQLRPTGDYAVYAAAIDSLVIRPIGNRQLVVISPTFGGEPEMLGLIETIGRDAKIPEEVRVSFVTINQRAVALEPQRLVLIVPVIVASEDSARVLQSRARLERSTGTRPPDFRFDVVHLSRVGFSRDSSHALLYLGHQCGGMCGTGWKVWLRRDRVRGWRVVTAETIWIA